jgi:hypothetical protein
MIKKIIKDTEKQMHSSVAQILPLSLLDYRAACHNISWCVVRTT